MDAPTWPRMALQPPSSASVHYFRGQLDALMQSILDYFLALTHMASLRSRQDQSLRTCEASIESQIAIWTCACRKRNP